jgi:hypothetical protein
MAPEIAGDFAAPIRELSDKRLPHTRIGFSVYSRAHARIECVENDLLNIDPIRIANTCNRIECSANRFVSLALTHFATFTRRLRCAARRSRDASFSACVIVRAVTTGEM